MRRPIALVCVATLLLVALALPLAGPVAVVCDTLFAFSVPARVVLASHPPRDLTPQPQAEVVALLLFRGPPADRVFVENPSKNPRQEETWPARRDCSRSC